MYRLHQCKYQLGSDVENLYLNTHYFPEFKHLDQISIHYLTNPTTQNQDYTSMHLYLTTSLQDIDTSHAQEMDSNYLQYIELSHLNPNKIHDKQVLGNKYQQIQLSPSGSIKIFLQKNMYLTDKLF